MKNKNILFMAPLPPPTCGHSLISKVLFEYLLKNNNVNLINLIHNSNSNGVFSIRRVISVLKILIKLIKLPNNTFKIYFTISESFLGNIKDIIIYILLFKKLNKLIIHLHGGSIDKDIFQKFPILKKINHFFYERLSLIIISGESHREIFSMVKKNNIVVVPNFVKDDLFIKKSISKKFEEKERIKILYLSAMDKKKGYLDLLKGIEKTLKIYPDIFEFNFAGSFKCKEDEVNFKKIIKSSKNIIYHGFVDDFKKKELLHKSHIFCLPTKYNEGQPISIFRAYASGCVVLTTPKPGILDIFKKDINGYLIEEGSPSSIKNILVSLVSKKDEFQNIGKLNLQIANKIYRQNLYCERIQSLLNG